MTFKLLWLTLLVAMSLMGESRADFTDEVQLANRSKALRAALEKAEELSGGGDVDAGNALILAVFPSEKRSIAESFVLGNILFRHDPKQSRELHEKCVKALPDEPLVQLEWGMQQHRAKKYVEASAAYAAYLNANEDDARIWGLMAECLIRQGKAKDASDAWVNSEESKSGSLVQFEALVCEINGGLYPDRDRNVLRQRVAKGDVEAAADLVALDAAFQRDWWNAPCRTDALKSDLKLIRDHCPQASLKLKEILCAVEATVAKEDDDGDVAKVLREFGFLIDDKQTLPHDGKMLSLMLKAAVGKEVDSPDELTKRLGTRILEHARATKHPETFRLAAELHVETPEFDAIVKEGWETVKDATFANLTLLILQRDKKLTRDEPLVIEIGKKFPEDARIQNTLVRLAIAEGKGVPEALEQAIKAEYSTFSTAPPLSVRPNARTLRAYFAFLAKELAKDTKSE